MLNNITKFFKVETAVLLLSILILLNYLIILINYNNFIIKLVLSLYILLTVLFFVYKPLNFFCLKLTLILLILIILGNPTYQWDAWAIWLFKAKRIYFEQSLFVFFDNYAPWSHNDYPLIAPAFAASLGTLIGGWNNIFPKLAFLLMYFPPLILSVKAFDFRYNLLFLIITLVLFNLEFILGYMDGLVALYFTFSAYLINEIFFNNKKSYIYILTTFCFLSILSLLKNEGAVLTVILLSSIIINNLVNKKVLINFDRTIIIFFSLALFLLWKFLCIQNGIESIFLNKDTLSNSKNLLLNFKSLLLIFKFLILDPRFLVSLLFFLITFYFAKNKKIFYFCIYLSLAYLIVLFYTFLNTPYPLLWHLETASSRIILSLAYLLSFFSLLEIYLNQIKKLYR